MGKRCSYVLALAILSFLIIISTSDAISTHKGITELSGKHGISLVFSDKQKPLSLQGNLCFRRPLGNSAGPIELVGTIHSPPIIFLDSDGRKTEADSLQRTIQSSAHKVDMITKYIGGHSSIWTLHTTYVLEKDDTLLIRQALWSNALQKLIRFHGLTVYAGAGSSGSKKDEALFPGLEYLLGDEESSSTLDITSKDHIRFAPHPNKVTVPLMSVLYKGRMISLMWDPLQKWDGTHDRPRPLFSSPNKLENQNNHLMGLFLPSIDYGRESELDARTPYEMKPGKGLVVTARVVIREAKHSIDAVDDWIEFYGLPSPLKIPRSWKDEMKLCLEPYIGHMWSQDEQGFGWIPYDKQPRERDPNICAFLSDGSNVLGDSEFTQKIAERADFVADSIQGTGNSLRFAYRYGRVRQGLKEAKNSATGIIRSQKPDHSWRFYVSKDEMIAGFPRWKLGTSGETASGIVARSSYSLLRHARITGDQESLKAGLNSLEFLDELVRPQAAQVWEVPMHAPDILASGICCQAYVEAYRVTKDKHYLDKAIYWAKAGLPFVYFWQAPERDIMKFGSIAIFGSSIFVVPWFGKPVQWNGVAYASALRELAEYDKNFDWRRIATGLTACCVKQHITEPGDRYGLFPDNINMMNGSSGGPWISPLQHLFENVFSELGVESDIDTEIIAKGPWRVFVSAPAVINANLNQTSSQLEVRLKKALRNRSLSFTVAGLGKPIKVIWNGNEIPEGEKDAPGYWTYADDILVVTARTGGEGTGIVEYTSLQFNRRGEFDKPAAVVKVTAGKVSSFDESELSIAIENRSRYAMRNIRLHMAAPDGWTIAGPSPSDKANEANFDLLAIGSGGYASFSIKTTPASKDTDSYQWLEASISYELNGKEEQSHRALGVYVTNPLAAELDVKDAMVRDSQFVLTGNLRLTSTSKFGYELFVTFKCPVGWRTIPDPRRTVALDALESANIPVELIVPINTAFGKYEVEVLVDGSSGAMPSMTQEIELPVVCSRAKTPISVDGVLSEWIDTYRFPIANRVTHKNEFLPSPTSPDDLTAGMAAAWDDEYIYLSFDITDDVLVSVEPGPDIWNSDSIQIGMDGLCERSVDDWDANDHEWGITLSDEGPFVWCWIAPEGESTGERTRIRLAAKRDGVKTFYEAAIPWKDVGRLNPKAGDTVGVSFLVNDVDTDKQRKAMELGSGIGLRKEPSKFLMMMLGS